MEHTVVFNESISPNPYEPEVPSDYCPGPDNDTIANFHVTNKVS